MKKQQLAMINDCGVRAAAIRVRAARLMAGLTQSQLSSITGVGPTTISNIEKGMQFPSRKVLQYFYHEHRLDFNFMMAGLYAALPGDVQERIFPFLSSEMQTWDQKHNSS